MTNTLDSTGLVFDNLTTLIENLKNEFKNIYGSDINLESNSADAQLINIFALSIQDLKDKIMNVYNSFDPDSAEGINLDARVSINNIQRKGASYTIVPIDIIFNKTTSLAGLDSNAENIDGTGFTIKDNINNKYILLVSNAFNEGAYTVNFRSQTIGFIQPALNTINSFVDVIDGVVSVNNSQNINSIGQDDETDAQLRYRRQISTSKNSFGSGDSLIPKLLNIDNVIDCMVQDNKEDITDIYGIPAHSIWIIVYGGDEDEIANLIYENRLPGTGMKGNITKYIIQKNGLYYNIKFDRPEFETIYLKLNIQLLNGNLIDKTYITNAILNEFQYKLKEKANAVNIITFLKNLFEIEISISFCKFSRNNIDYYDYLETTNINNIFLLDATRIFINE